MRRGRSRYVKSARRAAPVDNNQKDLVAFLRGIGADVYIIDYPCDLLVGWRGVNYLLEVKNPNVQLKDQALRPVQEELKDEWRGQFAVVFTENDCLKALGALK